MSKSCKVIVGIQKSENRARLLGEPEMARQLKKAKIAASKLSLLQGLQSELFASARRRVVRHQESTDDWLDGQAAETKTDGRRQNKGATKRRSYSLSERLAYVESFENEHAATGKTVSQYVREHELPIVAFSKYLSVGIGGWRHPKARARLVQQVADNLKKTIKVTKSAPRWPKAEAELHREAKEKRAKGRKVSARWIQIRSRHWMKLHYPAVTDFKGGRAYQRRACRRWGFVPRKTTNFRSSTTLEKLASIQVYHKELRAIVSTPSEKTPRDRMDPKWGRFKPHKRISGDTVPLEYIGNHIANKVMVRTPSDALRKRFASGHLTFSGHRPADKQFPVALVFRNGSQGARISAAEKAAYHPLVRVYYQPKAWVDRRILSEITRDLLEFEKEAYPDDDDEGVWLGDNLDCQTRPEYRAQFAAAGYVVKNYPPGTSDKGPAPVDNGLGAEWKARIGVLQEMDLEDDDFALRWDNNSMSASEKRIKLTHWSGEAWKWCMEQSDHVRRYMEKAGGMMTADGSGDDLIKLEGLPEGHKYEFMHVEVDTDAPGEDDLEEDEEERPDEIPDADIEEVPLADEYHDVTDDPTELELFEEDPDMPHGYLFVESCPHVGNVKEMLKKKLMYRWDCGWAQGVITRRHTKGVLYNYFVEYVEDDGTTSQYRHGLKPANYYNAEDNPEGVWVLLEEIKQCTDIA